jgi:hypothetical protein
MGEWGLDWKGGGGRSVRDILYESRRNVIGAGGVVGIKGG